MIFCLPNVLLDPAGEEDLEQLAPKSPFLERESVARQLLRDRARALAHVAGGKILQRRAHDPEQIVTAVLIELRVLHRDDGVDQVPRKLVVGNGLAILDIDLAEDLVVPIEDHAGGFHLLELDEIKRRGLATQIGGENDGSK